MRILVVDDEQRLAEAISNILSRAKYTVDICFDGESGLDYALCDIYDVIVLDVMMPKMNGIDVLKELRKEGISTPVIMLTAKSEISDKVLGLDSGADDYLAKPFNTEELLARIRAMCRRHGEVAVNDDLQYGDVVLNTSNLKLKCGDNEIALTKKEFELFEYLINNKSIVVSKEQIIEKLWGFESEAEANHVEVYVSFLRKKLNFLNSIVKITTVRGVGYRLEF